MTDSIDPGLPARSSTGPTAGERLAALRKPTEKRGKPAHTSKIVAAGLSTTALFGMVAAMGWPTATQTAQSAALPTTTAAPAAPVVIPTTTPATIPTVSTTAAPVPATAAPVPATDAPVPATDAPVEIPVATPVVKAPVQKASKRIPSNIATKSSG